MQSEQEFCLRWNDHKSTLITIFESLLESNTLVDCTLAAEGQCLKAHKVVLSACSPYFQFLLTQHTDKHPIIILKDVKFEELRAMIDYMYRGEVNIPEDQLGPLLEAAESLQIRGLGGASVRDKHGEIDKLSSMKHFCNEKHHSPKRETCSDISGAKGTNGSSRNIQTRKKSLSPVPRKRICPTRSSNVDDESQNSKLEHQRQAQASPGLEITPIPSASSSSTQSSVPCRTSVWTEIAAEKPSLPISSNEKDVHSLSALSTFGRSLEESSGKNNWSDLGLKTPVSPNLSRTLLPSEESAGPVSEVLLVPKTEYLEIDEDSLTNVMLDEVPGMETSAPPHDDGDPGTSNFMPWIQNIEGIAHSIIGQETVGNFQSSQVCETSGIMTRGRRGIQNRKFIGNPSPQIRRHSSSSSKEYRRLRTLRRVKKDCMTEEEIEELRRYERERKRVQRARKAAVTQAGKSAASSALWSPSINWQ